MGCVGVRLPCCVVGRPVPVAGQAAGDKLPGRQCRSGWGEQGPARRRRRQKQHAALFELPMKVFRQVLAAGLPPRRCAAYDRAGCQPAHTRGHSILQPQVPADSMMRVLEAACDPEGRRGRAGSPNMGHPGDAEGGRAAGIPGMRQAAAARRHTSRPQTRGPAYSFCRAAPKAPQVAAAIAAILDGCLLFKQPIMAMREASGPAARAQRCCTPCLRVIQTSNQLIRELGAPLMNSAMDHCWLCYFVWTCRAKCRTSIGIIAPGAFSPLGQPRVWPADNK